MSLKTLVIVGSTGLVGSELTSALGPLVDTFDTVQLVASADSAGEMYSINGREYEVFEPAADTFEDATVIVLAVAPSVVRELLPYLETTDAHILDFSGVLFAHNKGALAAPYEKVIKNEKSAELKRYSLPHPIASALSVLFQEKTPSHITLSGYQSVAGAGKNGLDELWEQGLALYNHKGIEPDFFSQQIAFNCIPLVGLYGEQGVSTEEQKIIKHYQELVQYQNGASLQTSVSCTLVRVPVFHSCGMALTVHYDEAFSVNSFESMFQNLSDCTYYADPTSFPMHVSVSNDAYLHVGRVRSVNDRILTLWCVFDPIIFSIKQAHHLLEIMSEG